MNKEKVTVITGGGRGIGRAIALRLSQLTSVLVIGRTQGDLQSVCEEINQAGGSADFCVGDVGKESTAALAMQKIREHGWTVRNLVCNAGFGKGGPIVSFDPVKWREMFEVNVHGAFYFVQACLPDMIAQKGGTISIISSTAGLKGTKNDGAYSATKFALMGLAQSLADEYKKHNIVVVPICPGFVYTDMTERSIAGMMNHRQMTREQVEVRLASVNVQGRILLPAEIAEAVAYCSTAARVDSSGTSMLLTGKSDTRVLKLVNWVHEKAARAKTLLIPISGGSDSALSYAICSMAYPEKVMGVFMGPRNQLRCHEWFESIGKVVYHEEPGSTALGEIGRWAKFLEMSNASSAWLVGSRNHTEELTGLYSLASRVATFMPLSNVWKSEIMELCEQLAVPDAITTSSRRADPACGRPEELSEIPLELVDIFLKVECGLLPNISLEKLTAPQIEYLRHVVEQNEFKQFLPTRGPDLLW